MEPMDSGEPETQEIAKAGASDDDVFFSELSVEERERFLDSIYDQIAHLLPSREPPGWYTRISIVAFAVRIALPVLLSIILLNALGPVSMFEELPRAHARSQYNQPAGAGDERSVSPRNSQASQGELMVEHEEREQVVFLRRYQFFERSLVYMLAALTLVFLYGQALFRLGQRMLLLAWNDIESENERAMKGFPEADEWSRSGT